MRFGRLREVRLDVPDRHRRADPDDGLVGQLGLDAREDLALEVVRRRLDRGSSHPRSAAPPALEPAGIAFPGPHLHRARQSTRGWARPPPPGSAPRFSWVRARRRADRSPPADASTQLRRGFEVGMSPTRTTRPGAFPSANSSHPEQHVVMSDDGRAIVIAAPHAGRRFGEQRPARLACQPGRRVCDVLVTGSAHDGPVRLAGDPRRKFVDVVGVGGTRVLAHLGPGPSIGAPGPVGGVELLAVRGRAARAAGSSGGRARGDRPRPSSRRGRRARGGGSAVSRLGSWVPTSTNHLAAVPYSLIWSIAWPAPTSRSSGGRSAVRTISGTRASCASTTAG